VYLNNHFRGRLSSISASLLLFVSGELLKWQFPFTAAGEKTALLVAVLRSCLLPPAAQAFRR
jgi:hypothetical protein